MTKQQAHQFWVEKIHDKAEEIDPDSERDWYDLAYGFFLALEFEIEDAHEMASEARGVGT